MFSDKTGTLTQNKMEFKKFAVNGVVYGTLEPNESPIEGMCQSSANRVMNALRVRWPNSFKQDEAYYLNEFLQFLSICHTVVCDKDPLTGIMQY